MLKPPHRSRRKRVAHSVRRVCGGGSRVAPFVHSSMILYYVFNDFIMLAPQESRPRCSARVVAALALAWFLP